MEELSVEQARQAYKASHEMLRTLEESLEPFLADRGDIPTPDFTGDYATNAEAFLHSLIAAEGDSNGDVGELFEAILDTSPSDDQIDQFQSEEAHRELTERLVVYFGSIGDFEKKFGDMPDTEGHLEGLTTDLIDTLEMLGRALFVDEPNDTERARRIAETLEACRIVLRRKNLASPEPEDTQDNDE